MVPATTGPFGSLIRPDFGYFDTNKTIYLDNAGTAQKPRCVLQSLVKSYTDTNAPIGRSIYSLAEQATTHYETARAHIAQLHSVDPAEIIFTYSATDSINCVYYAWARHAITAGDEIIISVLEHSSNVICWQELAREKQAQLIIITMTPEYTLDYAQLEKSISARTKLIALTHTSHVVGSHTDIARVTRAAKKYTIPVLIDASQAVAHTQLTINALDIDFLVYSGHKIGAPLGIGVLYINKRRHAEIAQYRMGGGAIDREIPHRLEAGSPPGPAAHALATALTYQYTLMSQGDLTLYQAQLCAQFIEGVKNIPGLTLFGSPAELSKTGHLISFTIDTMHPHDIAAYLSQHQIAVRAGYHCAPLLGINSVRLSVYAYTTPEDIDACITALKSLRTF